MYRIMGEAGGKHVISAMQGDSMITYIQAQQNVCPRSHYPV